MADKDNILLGGNIQLAGFARIDGASMEVVRKVVGTFSQKVGRHGLVEGLKVTLKEVHKREKSELYEIHAHLFGKGHKFNASAMGRNLFMALDDALKRVEREAEHVLAKFK